MNLILMSILFQLKVFYDRAARADRQGDSLQLTEKMRKFQGGGCSCAGAGGLASRAAAGVGGGGRIAAIVPRDNTSSSHDLRP